MIKRTLIRGLMTGLLAFSAFAAEALPAIDQVVEQHIRALGGRAVLEKASMLILSGDCESTAEEETGPVEILVGSPKVAFDLKNGALRMGFTGEEVWRHVGAEAVQRRAGRQYAEVITVFDPARAQWWKQWYPKMAVTGVEKVNGRDAYVIQMAPDSKTSERLLIDRETGLISRDEILPGLTFTFEDYRPVKGLQVAFQIQQSTPTSVKYTYRFKEVKPVTAIDPSRFQAK